MRELLHEERKDILLEIMDEIDRFCNEFELNYYLAYGSLIGAVRHNGFIPWDDDIDIVMFRNDYEKFLKMFNESRSDSYKVVSMHNEYKFDLAFAKVCDMRTKIIDGGEDPADIGVNIDIFPIDYGSSDLKQVKKLLHKVRFLKLMVKAKSSKKRDDRRLVEKILITAVKPISRHKLLVCINSMIQAYKAKEDSAYCANMTTLPYGDREIVRTEWFRERIKVSFENRLYYAPKNYNAILNHIYGEYMKLPPEEKRVAHTNIAYWRE